MDAPVYQVELTWNGSGQVSPKKTNFGPAKSSTLGACNGEECGLLADS